MRGMNNYLTVKDIATQWGVTTTWVSILCNQGRICGAVKQGKKWLIPANAERPQDLRKSTKTEDDAKFRFIDLFAGIGGFHQAMRYLGGKCVMAAEINQACQETYKLNFSTEEGDARLVYFVANGPFRAGLKWYTFWRILAYFT